MTEDGKNSISLTDKERLYEKLCREAGRFDQGALFPGIDQEAQTYFEEYGTQPVLEVYEIRNRTELERRLDLCMGEGLTELKKECVRAYFKSAARFAEDQGNGPAVGSRRGIPEFIYNF